MPSRCRDVDPGGVASDGGIFAFGDTQFYGSMGGVRLNEPVMPMAPDPDGVGYWLVASDGRIFGSTRRSTARWVASSSTNRCAASSPTGGGYLMVAEDGGIFSFGDVPFHGSLGGNPPAAPVYSVAVMP